MKRFYALILKLWLFIFYTASVAYLELVYRLWNFKNLSFDILFPFLFAVSAGAVLFVFTRLLPPKISRITAFVLTFLLILLYGVQLIYYRIFHIPLSLYSLTGAGDAMQFGNTIQSAILKNAPGLLLLTVPMAFLIWKGRKLDFSRMRPISLHIALFFCIASYDASVICINLTGQSGFSQYMLYNKVDSPQLSVNRLGLMTTVRLDMERLIFGFDPDSGDDTEDIPTFIDNAAASPTPGDKAQPGTNTPALSAAVPAMPVEYNKMDIDFDGLKAREKNETILGMHRYFSAVQPTKKNEYTGRFKGNNLILITAESFSPYAISPELTPTLYKMATEGFAFKQFYNPLWGVSTSDGEYVACTGILPKSGVWSFEQSGKNWMPFVMGNQFKKLDYTTKAYHDHSYKYYKRNVSHPNMGYEYKGVGNGLNIEKTWPESDVDMIEATTPEFLTEKPFHTYYMTVSGHMEYNFFGNYIADKNESLVKDLPYSTAAKAYIACNLELEAAMKLLLEKLEAAGAADNTVIAISPDHYPYGLPKESIDELAGHKVEENFELFKSTFILWKKGMTPVTIDKPCSSLDIIPTLSNLFGLEYDSRLLMGSDILSDAPPLVMFLNRSWITGKAMYNSMENSVTWKEGAAEDSAYIEAVHKTVAGKFEFSAKILENDYYGKVIPKPKNK